MDIYIYMILLIVLYVLWYGTEYLIYYNLFDILLFYIN